MSSKITIFGTFAKNADIIKFSLAARLQKVVKLYVDHVS